MHSPRAPRASSRLEGSRGARVAAAMCRALAVRVAGVAGRSLAERRALAACLVLAMPLGAAAFIVFLSAPLRLAAQDRATLSSPGAPSLPAAVDNPGFESDFDSRGGPPGWEISGEGYELGIDSDEAAQGGRSLVVRIDSARGFARVIQHVEPPRARADRWRVWASFRESAGTVGSAGSGRSAGSASSPGSTVSAGSARSAGTAGSARPVASVRSGAALRIRIDADDGLLYVDSAAVERPRVDSDDAGRGAGADSWRRFAVEAPAFPEAASVEIGATFQGPGTYWVDGFEISELETASLPEPSAAAKQYFDAALDVMKSSSIRSAAVDWTGLEAAALRQLRGAKTPADAHLAVRYAIALLGDRHSYLLSPARSAELEAEPVSNARTGRAVIEPRGARIAPGIAYLLVPGFAGGRPEDQVALAQSLQDTIRLLDAGTSEGGTSTCGWILDLRQNSGGNLWPMLLGVGPLIGDGDAGAAVYSDGRRVPFWYREGRVGLGDYAQLRVTRPYRLRRADPYVAVLLGERTASSGEILAGAFRGLPRRRSFGVPTSGLATGNKNFLLADGATLVLTVSATSDRTGQVVIGPLMPDEAAPERGALEAALRWLGAQCAFVAEGAG